MKKFLFIILALSGLSIAQVTGYSDTFDNNDISNWETEGNHNRTFQLSGEDNTLKNNYTRTANSGAWDNFFFDPNIDIDINGKAYISFKAKSDINTVFSIKPIFADGSDAWIDVNLSDDNTWHSYSYEILYSANSVVERIYCYLDGGSTAIKSGVVYFDDVKIGDSAEVTLNYFDLETAIGDAESLLNSTTEGTGEGEFNPGSKSELQAAVQTAIDFQNNGQGNANDVRLQTRALYDACVTYESEVNTIEVNLIDPKANKQTRYLYLNLFDLTERGIMFGMHDATGYGVGWSNDDDRSDVKDVCGDFPAVYSEDVYQITRGNKARCKYRVTNAYRRGGITTFVWHQWDPQGRGFYSWDVNEERIAETILPGGVYHEYYKDKLLVIADFFKSLRGDNGEAIPVIFRPYHEHIGDWFWWGPSHCTTQEYNDLWNFTKTYLHDTLNVHNLIWAISPSLDHVRNGDTYFNVYPGDESVDILGVDHYFGDNIYNSDLDHYKGGLNTVSEHSVNRAKLAALTEVGQEAIDTETFFTDVLLDPFKGDSVRGRISYSAVWRNESTAHHYAPFPGHASVPDFLEYYADPYVYFEQDLPEMYLMPEEDFNPPVILTSIDTTILVTETEFTIDLVTDERAYLKYDFTDASYDNMLFEFETGQASYRHTTPVTGEQGETISLYVHTRDLFGNTSDQATVIQYEIDTLKRAIEWYQPLYSYNKWSEGDAPLGYNSAGTSIQNVKTAYFKKYLNIAAKPTELAILVKSAGGGAVYVNGTEIGRVNLPEGELGYETIPSSSANFTKVFTLTSAQLDLFEVGDNFVSVEIHAADGNAVQNFDSQIFSSSAVYVAQGDTWAYFDNGYKPTSQTIGYLLPVEEDALIPASNKLYPNYPNPFNPSTTISFDLASDMNVQLTIYNVLGQKVRTLINTGMKAGSHQVQFNAHGLASGMYIYKLETGDFTKVKKMMLLK